MIVKMYSIRDLKTDCYEPPFPSANDATATRIFGNIMSTIPTMRDYPEDYNLHYVGDFDNEKCALIPATTQFVISGINCVKQPQHSDINHETTKISNDAPIQPST